MPQLLQYVYSFGAALRSRSVAVARAVAHSFYSHLEIVQESGKWHIVFSYSVVAL